MFIFKVMVCFLVVFSSEDCVGGLPAIQDSRDNDRAGQTVGSASNQRIANEPVSRGPGDSLDYAERHLEDTTSGKVTPGEISPVIPCDKQTTKSFDSENGNNPREGSSGADRCDKSKSRKDQATTATEALISQGDAETQGFHDTSSLEEELEKNKEKSEEKATSLLSEKTNVPEPEEDITSQDDLPLENRQRKSLADVIRWQQSTNMRPTRTQYLVQNKRSTAEGSLKLPGNGGRRSFARNARIQEPIKRRYDTGNQLEFAALNPVQINAAAAYSGRGNPQPLNLDLSRALYQFGPAQLHALRGVFDKVPQPTQNFKPIAPKQVAYVPPRIVYETKIVPTPFMPFRTEQKTVEALSALLGQNPAQQLQGLNMILRKDKAEEATPGPVSTPEISRQGVHDVVALRQSFVTPVPSDDINSGLGDGSFRFSSGGDPNEDIRPVIESPFDHKTLGYPVRENDEIRENKFKHVPIVEQQEETPIVQEELPEGWNDDDAREHTGSENEGRYQHQQDQESNHGEAYAAKYNFGYHVKDYESGNDFGHQESRDGVITNGRYHVLLPDGRIQNVKYHVDEGGYHAKVSYQLQSHSE